MSLCDDDFLVLIGTDVLVVGASTTVDSVVVTATVVVVVGADVDVVVELVELVVEEDVVVAAALVTVKPVEASSSVLWARTVALPALAEGGTVRGPPVNVAEPLESAVPILVVVPDWMKSMRMQLGLSAAHAR
jgi:hypothetical protein